MELQLFQVDAFANELFEGNPAAVVPLQSWLPDETMQKIAAENNLSETAFFIPVENGFHIRWFTPAAEVDLCGHATLASAHVLFQHLKYADDEIQFESRSGKLMVKRQNDKIVLNFPSSNLAEVEIPEFVKKAFNIQPESCLKGRDDFMLIFKNEKDIHLLNPDFSKFKAGKSRGVIATAQSIEFDFISRFFAPEVGINEDPVTGSAHTMLIPYWSEKLNKTTMIAKQVSKRGGILHCKFFGNRVEIGGNAATYLTGKIFI